jgi:hypothetical protein
MAERDEFELSVPICEQSDDSLRLSFATSRQNAIALQRISSLIVQVRYQLRRAVIPRNSALFVHQSGDRYPSKPIADGSKAPLALTRVSGAPKQPLVASLCRRGSF